MPLLSCHGLTRMPWLGRVDFEIDPGELVLLEGATGSGKSIFLRALADLDEVDGGSVFLEGRERSAFAPTEWRRRVLYLHQSAPRLEGRVSDDLERIAQLSQRPRGEALPNPLGLRLDAETRRLSGGEAQALALTRALITDPDVVLLDEGTSALDPLAARKAETALAGLLERGRAILWVSHDERIAKRMGARVLRLEDRGLRATGNR